MAHHRRTELVLDALNMACGQRRPSEVIHHSDQGSQYTSVAFGNRCHQGQIRVSMGSVGDCYDNEPVASFTNWPNTLLYLKITVPRNDLSYLQIRPFDCAHAS
jgi:transposase InsO family protein